MFEPAGQLPVTPWLNCPTARSVLAEGAVAERVYVRRAALVGAEAAGDDAGGAGGEPGAVAVVGDRGGDARLGEVRQQMPVSMMSPKKVPSCIG